MNTNKIFYLICLIPLLLGSYSCSYDTDDNNYVDVKKPKEKIRIDIDLRGVKPDEIIYAYNNSYFNYSVYAENKNILEQMLYLDGNQLSLDNYQGFYLNVPEGDDRIHELKLVVAVKSGSGSLADYVDLERYIGEFSFRIKCVSSNTKLNIRQTSDQEGYLKLEWDKPTDMDVLEYLVYEGDPYYGKLLKTINNPDETFFVDPDFVYGNKYYNIVAKPKNGINSSVKIQDEFSVSYYNNAELKYTFNRIASDQIAVKWESLVPFPCKYVLTYYDPYSNNTVIYADINEAILPFIFPTYQSFDLYILPKSADVSQYQQYHSVYSYIRDSSFSYLSFAADRTNNLLHVLDAYTVTSYDINTMKKVNTVAHNYGMQGFERIQVTTDGKIIFNAANGIVHIYSDYTLNNKIEQVKIDDFQYFQLFDNNKLMLCSQNGFSIYNMDTKSFIAHKTWANQYNYNFRIAASIASNGKYIYVKCSDYTNSSVYGEHWIELLQFENNTFTLLEKTDIGNNVSFVVFNRLKPNEAVFQYENYLSDKNFTVIDVVTKQTKDIKGELMHFDPFTGNVLFKDNCRNDDNNCSIHIVDSEYEKELFQMKIKNQGGYDLYSFNGHLFFHDFYLNLKNLKEWKQ